MLSIDQEPELLEKEIAIMGDAQNEYLVGFIGYFVIKRQVAVSQQSPLTLRTKNTYSRTGIAARATLTPHLAQIVMEYCGAGTASELMERPGDNDDIPLPENVLAAICCHTLRGLAYLHSERKIHRDIKGCNILLAEGGIAKLGSNLLCDSRTTTLFSCQCAVVPALP